MKKKFDNIECGDYWDDFEEIRNLLLYSVELLHRLSGEKTLENMTIPQLKKKNEFLKNGLTDIQRMLNRQANYGSFE